ncbi:hypothetical protein ACFCYF_13380 [Streptomyces chartreusis]|nr:hypothetical protein [Streptomyces chartreusis]WUB22984.1 hypothetical protein OG997_42545 [Streptomyces chartreusis]
MTQQGARQLLIRGLKGALGEAAGCRCPHRHLGEAWAANTPIRQFS